MTKGKIVNPIKAFPINKETKKQQYKKGIKDEKKKNKFANNKKSYLNSNISSIRCKMKRMEILFKKQKEVKKVKSKARKLRQEEYKQTGKKPEEPLTIEDKREVDENFVYEENEELQKEEQFDEFAEYFDKTITPKILMTTNNRPKGDLFDFLKEIKTAFPNCYYWPRKNYSLKEICDYAPTKQYTDIMVWRENKRKVDQLILIHLPKGPTAIFKVTSCILNQDIIHHGNPTDHYPELILNNFNSKVGRRIGRFFASLFPQRPDFKGRTVATFHNQRDYIFFRHHRYIFKEEGERVAMQEIGPRFTLKLQKLQMGIFDNVFGEIEFQSKDDMYVSRKRTYI